MSCINFCLVGTVVGELELPGDAVDVSPEVELSQAQLPSGLLELASCIQVVVQQGPN